MRGRPAASQRDIGLFYFNELGDEFHAREHVMRAFQIDPTQSDLAILLGSQVELDSPRPDVATRVSNLP
jgi:hypothetical protein